MSTREKRNLKGAVRRVETLFTAFETPDGKPTGATRETPGYELYDQDGRLLEQAAPERILMEGVHKDIYIYDAAGRLVRREEYDENRSLTGLTRFGRDPDGHVLETFYRFDLAGKPKPVSHTLYDSNGNFLEKVYYDENGRVDTRHGFRSATVADVRKRTELDDGFQIEELRFDQENNLSDRIVTIYDRQGNVTEYSLYEPDGTLYLKDEYTYEYDEAGNWTVRTQYHWASNWGEFRLVPLTVTRRKIEYF